MDLTYPILVWNQAFMQRIVGNNRMFRNSDRNGVSRVTITAKLLF